MGISLPARYALADRLLHAALDGGLRNARLLPHWIEGTDTFWCERWVGGEQQLVLVDADAGTVTPVTCEELPAAATSAPVDPTLAVNPQGTYAAFVRDDDVWVRDLATGEERALTTDGQDDWAYGLDTHTTGTRLALMRNGLPPQVRGAWSPDGTRFLTHRVDERAVERIPMVESSPSLGAAPVVTSVPFARPGAAHVPAYHLVVLGLDGTRTEVRHPGLVATRMAFSPFATGCAWWSADGARVYLIDVERGEKRVTVSVADPASGDVRPLFAETSETFLDVGWDVYGPIGAWYLPENEQLLWMSERSGWMQLYRYDLRTGELLNAVTEGEFVVRDLLLVDAVSQSVTFTANGREQGWDRYAKGIYRVGFDGRELTLLTPDPADHEVLVPTHVVKVILRMTSPGTNLDDVSGVSPSGRFLVASATTSGEPPAHSLFSLDGKKVLDLATVEPAEGLEVRWPERFTAVGADGSTPVCGLLFLPAHLEEGERLPVLDHVYLGPQTSVAAITDVTSVFAASFWMQSAALAALGFAVVLIDGRGLPFRDKAFHDHSYGAIGRTSDLDDHVAAIAQLRERYRAMGDRVGAIGHSGGGFGAARAVLTQPETYVVAVASAGNHDQRLFSFCWGERFMGLPVDERWEEHSNATHAAKLQGSLLLVHGESDQGVHPVHTLQLVDALVKAGKPVDMLLVPGGDHGVTGIGTVTKQMWDYLVRHLAGLEPPADAPVRSMADVVAALLAPEQQA